MLKQRQVGEMFDSCARAIGAARRPALAVPLAMLLVAGAMSTSLRGDPGASAPAEMWIDAGGAVSHPPMFASLFTPRHVMPRLALPWESSSARRDVMASPAALRPASRAPSSLTPEQRKIAQFVARKYRIAMADVQHLVAYAYRSAKEFRLDPHLVLAVMSIESSFNPDARSPAGAQGLMQVLTRVHADKFARFGGASAAFDPMANISVGTRILKEYLVREGSVEGALKSYVGAALHEHDSGYGYKVLSERERISAAAAGRPIPILPPKPSVAVAGADSGPARAAASPVLPAPANSPVIAPATLRQSDRPDTPAGAPDDAWPGGVDAPMPQPTPMLDAAVDLPATSTTSTAGESLARAQRRFAARAG